LVLRGALVCELEHSGRVDPLLQQIEAPGLAGQPSGAMRMAGFVVTCALNSRPNTPAVSFGMLAIM